MVEGLFSRHNLNSIDPNFNNFWIFWKKVRLDHSNGTINVHIF